MEELSRGIKIFFQTNKCMLAVALKNKPLWILLLVLFFLATWSPTGTFVEFPKYWHDEAFAMEQARTFLELGRLDFIVAPNTPSGMAIALSANGPPLSIPLAGVFYLFGIGLLQARVYMLFWLIAVTIAVYLFLKKTFDTPSAVAGTLLMATFASFYANGRTATGDIPGLFFCVIALYFFVHKRQYAWSGIFFALAAVTKTSAFHMALPAAGIVLLFFEKKLFFLPAIRFGTGALLVILMWFLILLPYPYSLSDLTPLIEFYQNPTHKASLLEQFSGGIPSLLFSSTIGYFGILALIVFVAFFKSRRTMSDAQKRVYVFVATYAVLQAIVFLRSPGWIRYLVALEIFILMLLFPALSALAPSKKISYALVGFLAGFQFAHYLSFSNILPRADITPHVAALNQLLDEHTGSTIGFIDNLMTSAFIPSSKKFNYIHFGGSTAGAHPFTLPQEEWPDFMDSIGPEYAHIQEYFYEPFYLSDGEIVFRKK